MVLQSLIFCRQYKLMNKNKFPNTKLNLPKELKKDDKEIFENIESYLSSVSEYIYTDINLDFDIDDVNQKDAWVLKIVSAYLLRSLYLRNAVVDAINSRNIAALHLALKAEFELVGALVSVLELLNKKISLKDFKDKFVPYVMGNRGRSDFRVGSVESNNVLTMLEKADKYLVKVAKKAGKSGTEKYFTSFYDTASNASHPTSDSNGLVGNIKDVTWVAKSPNEFKQLITDTRMEYGGLLTSFSIIPFICEEIFEKLGDFKDRIECKRYFD